MKKHLGYGRIALLVTLGVAASTSSQAAIVNLTGIDGFGASSFNSVGLWSDSAAPSAGNDYVVPTGTRLRTPADGGSYTFEGDSLTVSNTDPYPEGLMYKGTGATGVVTIPNLILDGGLINHANGLGDLFQLDGAVNVASDSRIHAKQGSIDVLAPISGTGGLTVLSTDGAGRVLRLLGANTYTGDIVVEAVAELELGDTGALTFAIGSVGANNGVSGDGAAVYNGAFSFDLTSASAVLGDSWTITDVATQSFGDSFNVDGFVESGNQWTSGSYLFDESTGVLSVVPEPTSAMIAVGVLAIVGARNRRK